MSEDTDTTQWSLPGPADMPRDTLQMQLEVYKETILLRGFDSDTAWVRTVSADAIANVFTQHLGFSSGLLPEAALWWNQGETGQVVALWRPPQVWSVALQQEAFKPPARLRLPMPGLVFVCSPGRAPWVYAALGRPSDPEQQLFRAPAFNVFSDGRVCPGSHRFPEDVGLIPESFFQSFFSLTGDSRDRSKKRPDNLVALWEELDGTTAYPIEDLDKLRTRLRTWFPSARWARRWRSPRGDVATASPVPGPVGYLVNHPGGLAGVQGIGYDYVLGSGGVYVQSQGAHLTARVPVAPRHGAGARSRGREAATHSWPHPGKPVRAGAALVPGRPGHRAALRSPLGRGRLPAGGPPAGRDRNETRVSAPPQGWSPSSTPTEVPAPSSRPSTTGTSRASASTASSDASDAPRPELRLRVGVYGHFAPVDWPQVFDGPQPGVNTNHRLNEKEASKCPTTWTTRSCWTIPGSPWSAAAGPAASWPRVSAASSRGGRPPSSWSTTTGVEPHNLLRQNFYAEDVGRFKSQSLADRLARAFRRPVGYSVYAFREEDSRSDGGRYPGLPAYGNSLLIGCADNAAARRAMAEALPGDPRRWLIDAGNDTN